MSEGQHCLKFSYNMYGFHTGTLSVFLSTVEKYEEIWTKKKQQTASSEWKKAFVKINLHIDDKVNSAQFLSELNDY